MTKIIPRDLIKHLEWKPGQATAPITPVTNPVPQNTGSFNGDNASYSFLEGDFGRQVLEEYNQLVQSEYQNASALQKLSFVDDVVKGSNPFAFVLLNRVLQNHGRWVARPIDLEKALEKDAINLRGTYGDSGLVLRSENDPNEYLAKNLASQVKEKGYTVGRDSVMIPLAGFELVYDSNSPHNLVFQLTDSSEIIYAPQLNKTNHGKKFNGADEKGLPTFEDNGSRTLYSNEENGVCRLFRNWGLDLNARIRDLAASDDVGRVITCAEGTTPKN
ncbi:MAG: hypothetical protein ABIB79_04135 [archaeon]